jgi:hypothetical protein
MFHVEHSASENPPGLPKETISQPEMFHVEHLTTLIWGYPPCCHTHTVRFRCSPGSENTYPTLVNLTLGDVAAVRKFP